MDEQGGEKGKGQLGHPTIGDKDRDTGTVDEDSFLDALKTLDLYMSDDDTSLPHGSFWENDPIFKDGGLDKHLGIDQQGIEQVYDDSKDDATAEGESEGDMDLEVMWCGRLALEFEVHPHHQVADIQGGIQRHLRVPVNEQYLYFNDRRVYPEELFGNIPGFISGSQITVRHYRDNGEEFQANERMEAVVMEMHGHGRSLEEVVAMVTNFYNGTSPEAERQQVLQTSIGLDGVTSPEAKKQRVLETPAAVDMGTPSTSRYGRTLRPPLWLEEYVKPKPAEDDDSD